MVINIISKGFNCNSFMNGELVGLQSFQFNDSGYFYTQWSDTLDSHSLSVSLYEKYVDLNLIESK